jgi:DNA-directed RNA polymerase beta subunit
MIKFQSLVQYTRVVDSLRFLQDAKRPFALFYFSENSTFYDDYPKLNLRKIDAKYVVVPITRLPVSRLTGDLRKVYKSFGLIPFQSNQKYPVNRNIIFDTSQYVSLVDKTYKPQTYRTRAGFLINNFLFKSFSSFPENYQKVLIYTVDVNKPLNSFPNRKSFPLIRQMKDGEIFFDHMLLVLVDESSSRYRLLVKERDFKFGRVVQYMRRIKMTSTEEEKEEEVEKAADSVVDAAPPEVEKDSNVKTAVQNYLDKDEQSLEKVSNDELTEPEKDRLTVASILYRVTGDYSKATRIAKSIPDTNIKTAAVKISKLYKDDMLTGEKAISLSDSFIIQGMDVSKAVQKKTPEHIFDKRRIDFDTNLKKDMSNAFKVLETGTVPVKFQSISVSDKKSRSGELQPSDVATVCVKVKDAAGKIQEICFDIPKIDPKTGTFRVNGQRKCLINQIVLTPISFPKPYDSKFESSYSKFHIYSRKTKRLSYLEAYMGSFRLPLMILLSYSFGFANTAKKYGIQYEIVKEKPGKDETFTEVPSSYMVFKNLNTDLKKEMVTSFIHAKINQYNIDKEFLSKKYFEDLVIQMTGRVDSTYLINNNIEYIVDPVAKQVLVNEQLPYKLEDIIHYMASRSVEGYVQDRNDISHQRIRNSEVLVHLAQKQFLKSYTEYKEQYLSGNKDAKFNFPAGGILSQFINLEIVQNMEYANPVEEMATITKISPVGKTVGGVPDKEGLNLDARNVHRSYFGNIDPVDTAEGGNIGVTQQLTVDAYLTSARGLFGIKNLNDNEGAGILSTTLSMVPFIENNEGARMIMAGNQGKQMLPLKNPEPPVVGTGYESLLSNVLSDSFIKRSPCAGKVTRVTMDYIEVTCNKGAKQRVPMIPMQLKSGSGKNTLSTFKPVVVEGQPVKMNQVIAEGSCISGGTISLGRNLATCYMPFKGYNFEDGLIINERLVTQDKLTSLHGIDVEATVDAKDRVLHIIDIGVDTKKGEPLLRKTAGDIDELLGYQEEEEEGIDVYEGQIITKSPGGRVVDIEVFANIGAEKFPKLQKLIDRTNKKYKKPEREKYTNRGISVKGILVIFKIEQELKIGVGDKLCNRFGNKGIISYVEKDENMPRTPWGETVDIVMNPLGVTSRMNMGQMYELYCGLISREVARRMVKLSKAQGIALMKAVMTRLDNTKGKTLSQSLVKSLEAMSDQKYKQMLSQVSRNTFIPIIIPPFQAPKKQQIREVLKMLGLKTGYKMKIPEYNTTTASPVPFGYQYVSKLEHIGDAKLHSRSTGPTKGKTSQPTAGKRKEGGQKIGEGDTWALASYNCPTVLSEFFGPMSDDHATKNEMIAEIIQKGTTDFKETKVSPTRDLLRAYFISLMIGGQ